MEQKNSLEVKLFFLLIASLWSEAQLQYKYFSPPNRKLIWTDARSYCRSTHTDMLSWNTVSRNGLASQLKSTQNRRIWIGVHRDPEQPTVWRGINLMTGEGLSGEDLSQNTRWGAEEPDGSSCAFVSKRLKWYSSRCWAHRPFYCTNGDTVQFYNDSVPWSRALEYCRDNASVLSTVTELNKENFTWIGWIGLFSEDGHTWSWLDNSTFTYTNWARNDSLLMDCATFTASSKKWHATNCFSQFRFVCYEDNLVVVNERKTWEDAVRHCREMNTSCVDDTGHPTHCYDLLSLTNSLHYGYVTDKIYRATTDEVWVGLRFLGGEWWWLNGEKPEDQGMLPNCPSQWKHCGSFSKYNTSGVNAQQSLIIKDCSERQNFICQKGGKDWENDNEFKGLK